MAQLTLNYTTDKLQYIAIGDIWYYERDNIHYVVEIVEIRLWEDNKHTVSYKFLAMSCDNSNMRSESWDKLDKFLSIATNTKHTISQSDIKLQSIPHVLESKEDYKTVMYHMY